MKGVALLVALSTLGVDYSWRTTDEGQLEYVIQIEPEFIKALADGEEIHSDVPPEAGAMQRICVRIGTTPAKHSAASVQQYKRLLVSAGRYASTDPAVPAPDAVPTIVWPAKTLPEQSFNVTYGWQPDQTGQQAYYVQLDPALLQTLAAGDEIYASVDPTAGNVGRFVVLSGTKQLPRVAAKPAATPPSLAVNDNRNRFQPPTTGPATFDPVATTPPAGPPPFAPLPSTPDNSLYPSRPSRYGDTANDLRPPTVPLAPNNGYAPPTSPALNPPQNSFNPATLPQPPATYYPPTTPAPPTYADTRYGSQIQPPADTYAGQPGYVQRTGAEQPQARTSYAPPSYNPPPPAYNPQQPPTYNPPPPVDNRMASVTRDPPNSAALLPAPQISNAGAVRTAAVDADKPWWPLMFTAFALFLSIGGNLYLGWTAAEFHSRYRLAVDRLRSAGRN